MNEPKLKNYKSAFDRIDFLKIAEATIHNTAPCKAYAHFRIDHMKRVYFITRSLSESYPHGTFDLRKIGVMCAIHDMFKYATESEHGEKAAKYLKELFIDEYIPDDHPEREEWLKVIEAVKLHSMKNISELPDNKYLHILMDADMLDKLHPAHIKSLQRVFHNDLTLTQIMDNKLYENESYIGKSLGYEKKKDLMIKETKSNIKYGGR